MADGPLLILAGPGSGKTRVIAHRIAYLIREKQTPPWRILAVTFTNKAAREMRQRVGGLLGPDADPISMGTFHAVCSRMLRADGTAAGIPRGFVIYDDADQITVIKRALRDLGIDPKQFPPRAILSAISRAKSEEEGPARLRGASSNYFEEVVARVYEHYQAALETNAALDFDDLLLRALELLQRAPEVRERYQRRYQHVLVDEFQDTNVVQYRLARLWAGGSGNLTVVGDPDQSIYSWRSADLRNILHFEHDYPNATVVRLEQNYRSSGAILRVADAVIQRASERIHKALWTENDEGEPPIVYEAYSETDEAEYVVRELQAHVTREEWAPGDVAVMYRTNGQSRVVEEAFLRVGLATGWWVEPASTSAVRSRTCWLACAS